MKFEVQERLLLINVLSGYAGDVTTVRIVGDLLRDLSFDESEHKILKFVQTEKIMKWNDGAKAKEIFIGEKAGEIIASLFRTLSDQGKLTLEHLATYDRFVEDKTEKTA